MLRKLKSILSWSFYLFIILLITFFLITFVVQKNVVSGSSMSPTLEDGDVLITDKISYLFKAPQRYDIVVFPSKDKKGEYLIKRVIGMPGETVRIDNDGNILINNEILSERYGSEVIQDPGMASGDVNLSEGEYFVLGDNRNDSVDSRSPEVWILKKDSIIGRAVFRLWPNSRKL